MFLRLAKCLLIIFAIALSFNANAKDNANKLCRDFLGHLNQRKGLSAYRLEEIKTGEEDPNWSIPNVDIDQDKIYDRVLLFRTGSASLMPSDNSTLNVILSSTGKKFSFESPRFFVIRYRFTYYIVSGEWQSNDGPIKTDIHVMDRKGISLLCTYKCNAEKSFCAYR